MSGVHLFGLMVILSVINLWHIWHTCELLQGYYAIYRSRWSALIVVWPEQITWFSEMIQMWQSFILQMKECLLIMSHSRTCVISKLRTYPYFTVAWCLVFHTYTCKCDQGCVWILKYFLSVSLVSNSEKSRWMTYLCFARSCLKLILLSSLYKKSVKFIGTESTGGTIK